MGNISKINYSESRKLTTGKRFESRLISFSAEMDIGATDNIDIEKEKLRKFVRDSLETMLPKVVGV